MQRRSISRHEVALKSFAGSELFRGIGKLPNKPKGA